MKHSKYLLNVSIICLCLVYLAVVFSFLAVGTLELLKNLGIHPALCAVIFSVIVTAVPIVVGQLVRRVPKVLGGKV